MSTPPIHSYMEYGIRCTAYVLLYLVVTGLFFIIPCTDTYTKVDLRTVSFDVPPQEVNVLTTSLSLRRWLHFPRRQSHLKHTRPVPLCMFKVYIRCYATPKRLKLETRRAGSRVAVVLGEGTVGWDVRNTALRCIIWVGFNVPLNTL